MTADPDAALREAAEAVRDGISNGRTDVEIARAVLAFADDAPRLHERCFTLGCYLNEPPASPGLDVERLTDALDVPVVRRFMAANRPVRLVIAEAIAERYAALAADRETS